MGKGPTKSKDHLANLLDGYRIMGCSILGWWGSFLGLGPGDMGVNRAATFGGNCIHLDRVEQHEVHNFIKANLGDVAHLVTTLAPPVHANPVYVGFITFLACVRLEIFKQVGQFIHFG